MCHHALGQYQEGIDHFKIAVEHTGKCSKFETGRSEKKLKADIRFNMGLSYSQMGSKEMLIEAIDCYEKARVI
jgi:tetratricopeptide (TPR) repeat protein